MRILVKNMKQQILIIHGGWTFSTHEEYLKHLKNSPLDLERIRQKDWKSRLGEVLGSEYDVLTPHMPNKQNARYAEWKIYFDKIIPLLDERVIIVGHSMGGIFIAKYLAENKYPKKILATFLIAAPYEAGDYELTDFEIKGGLKQFTEQGGEIFLYQSSDDPSVPFSNLEQYQSELPMAHIRMYQDKQHFNQTEFPEIIEDIRSITAL